MGASHSDLAQSEKGMDSSTVKERHQPSTALPAPSARLHICGIGIREPCPRASCGLETADDFFIIFFHSRAHTRPSGENVCTREEGLYIYGPGTTRSNDCCEHGNHSWIRCRGRLADHWLKIHGLPVSTPISQASEETFVIFLQQVLRELTLTTMPDDRIIENLFENWLRDLSRNLSGVPASIPHKLLAAKDHLDLHFARELCLKDLAMITGWSGPHFSSEFRKHFGVSPFEYLITRRLEKAAGLLRDVNLNVTQVARSVGYADVYYFSKLFKKHTGRNPSSLRRSLLGKNCSPHSAVASQNHKNQVLSARHFR